MILLASGGYSAPYVAAGVNGQAWSSYATDSAKAHDLHFRADIVGPSWGPDFRYIGFSLRCLSTVIDIWSERLSSWWFAFGFGEKLLGLDFVAATINRRNIVIFSEEIDEHRQIFVVHDND